MLHVIEEMKFFLRTAYGDSKEFAGSTIQMKTQGLCQGNGAAPAGWCAISIVILRCHKQKGHGATFIAPISAVKQHVAAVLFVDDTDILHLNGIREESVVEAHEALQASVTNWGKLLIATGGTLKPTKCFSTLISFDWNLDGTWSYANHHEDEETKIFVPMPNGSSEAIEHVSVDTPKETLGIVTCASGASKGSLQAMKEKAKDWALAAVAGSLPRKLLWFSVARMFWPKVGYGLCCSTASVKELSTILQSQYYKLAPIGGIVRSSKKEIRQLDGGFYGAGFPHPAVEAAVVQCNKLLMHYGCQSSVGVQLQTSMELLLVELGMSFQPLSVDYDKFGALVTHSWLKTIWEKSDLFQFDVRVNNIPIKFVREGDEWLMLRFLRAGYNMDELLRLNRVQLHQQVLFLSDIICVGGKYIDQRYLTLRRLDDKWSSYRFPNEDPTEDDLHLWKEAISQIAPNGRLRDKLGNFIHQGHKIHHWRYHAQSECIFNTSGVVTQVYRHGRGGTDMFAVRTIQIKRYVAISAP